MVTFRTTGADWTTEGVLIVVIASGMSRSNVTGSDVLNLEIISALFLHRMLNVWSFVARSTNGVVTA